MTARVLSPKISLFTLLGEIRYTLSLLSAEPLGAAHVPTFKALSEEVRGILLQELDLIESLSDGQAAVDKADDGIDGIAGRVFHLVEDLTGGRADHPLRVHLFKKKSLGKFRKPVLRGQLANMKPWPSSLAESENEALKAFVPELKGLLTAADAAVEKQTEASSANRQFRDIGARKQFIDKVNAARKQTHGELSKLPFQQLGLPSNFADQFFRPETRAEEDDDEEEETIDTVKTSIAELDAQLTEKKALLKKLEDAAAAAAKAAAEKQEQGDKLAALKAQAADLLKQAAALEAELTER